MTTQNQRWANDGSKFGYQMLLKMGWKAGNGLGKNQQGTVSHVKVEANGEKAGIGIADDKAGDVAFTKQQDAFNILLDHLNSDDSSSTSKVTKSKAKKRKRKEREDVDKEKKQKSKKSKKKKSKKEGNLDKKRSHLKILKAKNVAGYSAEDLRAIFGRA